MLAVNFPISELIISIVVDVCVVVIVCGLMLALTTKWTLALVRWCEMHALYQRWKNRRNDGREDLE